MPGTALVVRLLCLAALLAPAGGASADELRDAVDRVRQETGGYILSAQTLRTHSGKVHRVKVLTREGRVEVRQIIGSVAAEPIGFTPPSRRDDGAMDDDGARDVGFWLDERRARGDASRGRLERRDADGERLRLEHQRSAARGRGDGFGARESRAAPGRDQEASFFERPGRGVPDREELPERQPD